MSKIFRNAVAGALITLTPVTATIAAVRPNAAVPVATSAVTAAQVQEDDRGISQFPWLPIGIIVAAIALGIYFGVSDNKDGQGNISRG